MQRFRKTKRTGNKFFRCRHDCYQKYPQWLYYVNMQEKVEDIVVFTVPGLIPCSVNHIWDDAIYTGRDGYAHRGRKLSKQAVAFKYAVAIFAQGRTVAPATERERKKAKYRVKVDVYFGPRQKGDGDNFLKNAIDSLVYAGVIHSDVNVIPTPEVHRDERHSPESPRTTYIVERL